MAKRKKRKNIGRLRSSNKLRIRCKSMFATQHSWSFTCQALCKEFIKMGHYLSITSTNGTEHIPEFFKPYMNRADDNSRFDLQFTYTVPKNLPDRFTPNGGTKLTLYNYESTELPSGWGNQYNQLTDYLSPASKYCKDLFLNSGVEPSRILTVPHGIATEWTQMDEVEPLVINTEKKFKFLCVAISHKRKNLEGLIRSYFQAFTSDDDVTLVLKTKVLNRPKVFEINVMAMIKNMIKEYFGDNGKCPEIILVTDFVPDLRSLYKACDAFVLPTRSEGFGLIYLEALAAELPIVAPRYSGHLDFLGDHNSLLTDVTEVQASGMMQYWRYTKGALIGAPKINHTADTMRKLYNEYDDIKARFLPEMKKTVSEYTWENAAHMLLKGMDLA